MWCELENRTDRSRTWCVDIQVPTPCVTEASRIKGGWKSRVRHVLKELTILNGRWGGLGPSGNHLISSPRLLGKLGHNLALSEKQVFPISSCFSLCYENDQGLKESCVCWAAIWSTHPTSVGETAQEPSPVFMMGWLCRDKLSGSKQACQFTEKAANQLSLFCTTLSLEFYPKDMKTGDWYHLSFLLSNTMELRFSESQGKNVIRVTEIRRKKM